MCTPEPQGQICWWTDGWNLPPMPCKNSNRCFSVGIAFDGDSCNSFLLLEVWQSTSAALSGGPRRPQSSIWRSFWPTRPKVFFWSWIVLSLSLEDWWHYRPHVNAWNAFPSIPFGLRLLVQCRYMAKILIEFFLPELGRVRTHWDWTRSSYTSSTNATPRLSFF